MGQVISSNHRRNKNIETVVASPPPAQASSNFTAETDINVPSDSKSWHSLPDGVEVRRYHPVEIHRVLPVLIDPMQASSSSTEFIPPPKPDYSAPPPYEVAAQTFNSKLPTYEEVEREKHLEGDQIGVPVLNDVQVCMTSRPGVLLTSEEAADEIDSSLLGTDFLFYTSFFVTFIFNWIGFVLLMCFSRSIASRYGALSGFGLSLAKWTFIVQHSTELSSRENTWLWWLLMIFGVLICIRAIIQYLNIKRNWDLYPNGSQERLLSLY